MTRPVPLWRRHARGACPGCGRIVGALRSPRTGNLLLRAHHRPRTHVVCEPPSGAGLAGRWWGRPTPEPCRGALHTRELTAIAARLGEGAAWRAIRVRDGVDVTFLELCPTHGHDEEPT